MIERLKNLLPSKREVSLSLMKLTCRKLCHIGQFEKASYTYNYLLDFLHDDNREFNAVIIEFFKEWLAARLSCKNLPSSVPVLQKWVKKALERADDDEDNDTLHSLLLNSIHMERSECEILLELELRAYEIMDKGLGRKMRIRIMDSLLKFVYAEKSFSFHKARILIKRRALGDDMINSIQDYITFLSEAIHSIRELKEHGYPFPHQLAVCYSLRALCHSENKGKPKVIFQDINSAVHIWINIFCDHTFSEAERAKLVSHTLPLFYHLLDFLSAQGRLEFHYNIYRLIIELFKLEKVSLEDIVATLWEFRRFSHASCCSPINEPFYKILSNLTEKWEKADFWKRCFQESKSLMISFQQQLSPYCFETPFGSCPTAENVNDAASPLLSTEHTSINSISRVAHLYHQLSEVLHLKGKLKWALYYASKAYALRVNLLHTKFASAKNVEKVKLPFQKYTGYSDIKLSTSVAAEYFSTNHNFKDSKGYIFTPSYILQCFLESVLQIGILNEKMGDEEKARGFLLDGKEISSSQGLPVFEMAFASVLGRIHKKKQDSNMGIEEFKLSRELRRKCKAVTCSKCKDLLTTSIALQHGDLCTKKSDARNCYSRALDSLISEWKEAPRKPNEAIEIKNCWQSLPSDMVKCKSISDLIQMKWDYTRRSLALKILSAKAEEEEIFLKSLSLLVGENPFSCTYSSAKLLELSGMKVSGDVLAIERATVLLNIALFCQKNKRRNCFNQPQISHERIKSWLLLAFSLSQDVPVLLRKVSRLLAVIYFDPGKSFFLPLPSDSLYANHYALFYHQASVGTHFENQQLSRMIEINNLNSEMGANELGVNREEIRVTEEKYVSNFFKNQPSSSTVIISVFGQDSKSILEEKDGSPHGSTKKRKNGGSVTSWILVSYLDSNGGSIVLLPLNYIPQEHFDYDNVFHGGRDGRNWTCHWGYTTIDKLAPEFRLIMNEIATDRRPGKEDTLETIQEFKRRRRCLDSRLLKLLH